LLILKASNFAYGAEGQTVDPIILKCPLSETSNGPWNNIAE